MGPSVCMASSNRSGSSGRVGSKGDTLEHGVSILPEYNLRPRSVQNRLDTERKRYVRKEPKPKQKPPPLSKYRRKNANARERSRMTEINQAFEDLRRAVPRLPGDHQQDDDVSGGSNSKLTKITTLRLAMNYIKALSQILQEQEDEEATTGVVVTNRSAVSTGCASSGPSSGDAAMTTGHSTDTVDHLVGGSSALLMTSVDDVRVFMDKADGHRGLLDGDDDDVLRGVLDCPLAAALSEDSSLASSAVDSLRVSVEDFPSLLASPSSGFDGLLESDGESIAFSDHS